MVLVYTARADSPGLQAPHSWSIPTERRPDTARGILLGGGVQDGMMTVPASPPTEPSIAAQTRYWDERWHHQSSPNDWQLQRAEAVVRLARELPLKYPRILDLGCGTGFTTDMLNRLGRAEGIDLSPEAIAIATDHYPGVAFRAGDLFEIELAEEPVDLVVCQEVIPHVSDQSGLVDLIADALVPGGYLIITAANRFVMSRLTGRHDGPVGCGPRDPQSHLKHWLSRRQLKAVLRPRFDILHSTSMLPMGHEGVLRVINSFKVNAMVGRVVGPARIEALKNRLGWGYTLIVVARKRD